MRRNENDISNNAFSQEGAVKKFMSLTCCKQRGASEKILTVGAMCAALECGEKEKDNRS